MLGDEELGKVYQAEFFAWYAQRVIKKNSEALAKATGSIRTSVDTFFCFLGHILKGINPFKTIFSFGEKSQSI